MRVVALGDVGVVDDMMHIGDEAMFQAARDEIAVRGGSLVAISSAPNETAARYGLDAVPRIRFDGLDRTDADARLAAVLALAEGRDSLAADDTARAVVDAVAGADGVLITGGGNLASTWPLHVYERAALAGIAARVGRPLVVSGQTLGPDLRGRDRELTAGLLRSAELVGVRESRSHDLAADLGVHARLGVDDASFLGMPAPDAAPARAGVLVSLSLSLGRAPRTETVTRIAALVDAAADMTGGPVRFHAHYGPLIGTEPRGDAVLHDQVRARMRVPSTVVPTGDATAAASLARSTALLITGRYHPAVFAAPAGVPMLGLVTDDYTAVKQRGALAHWGQDATVPIAEADTAGIPQILSLWRNRARIADAAAERLPRHRADAEDWWDAIAITLG
ncbi:Polysaccharide pyruvyl transferase family protein WcaK [Microbacterium sp. cf046]|uniref:polysaccharide pyruvyl transferase family protein n=1 Tax=Microbacterium sp. cf046 TaxID=1761803 RepID=UPI0008E1BE84|nr:polysaccharide pyruvyl transferase family protein [Microbacterium sp. cf046]SFR91844.1 Polysaccharide pyruvyl transferase family protein WcaK [Microbacterium sp. cf046]